MPRSKWLTPDTLPTTSTCYEIVVPDSVEIEAIVRGCILLLCDPDNWEDYGGQTPDDVAALMWDTVGQFLDMTPCS